MKKIVNFLEKIIFHEHAKGEKIEYDSKELLINRTIVPLEFEKNYPYWDKELYNNIIYI
jgi:hypothetical protein